MGPPQAPSVNNYQTLERLLTFCSHAYQSIGVSLGGNISFFCFTLLVETTVTLVTPNINMGFV